MCKFISICLLSLFVLGVNPTAWGRLKIPMPISGKPVAGMERFEKRFVGMLKVWHIPGASVAIMKNGKLTYARGFGWAHIRKRIPVQPNSLFRIASISKAITAVAILNLIQEHKLTLKSKVFSLLNDLKPINGKARDKRLKQVKVQDLLYMSSGWIPSGKRHYDPMFGPWSRHLVNLIGYDNLPASCRDTIRMMLAVRKHGGAGRYYAYSNLDYCLLGLVIDKVNHAAYNYLGYQNYIQSKILAPLGITDMSIGSTLKSKRKPNEVYYYRYAGPINIDYQGISTYLPYSPKEMLQKNFSNGGWIGSAIDLVTFANAVNRGHVFGSALRNKMLSPPPFMKKKSAWYYAMGWKVKKTKKSRYWYQTGSFTGTNALVMVKRDGTCIALVFNARPPIYHLWRNFRPQLKRLFKLSAEPEQWRAWG